VTEEGLDVIAMVKKSAKTHYRYKGEMLAATEIYKRNKNAREQFFVFAGY
jgi:hypothetical protein